MRPKANDEKPTHYCARLQSRLLAYLDGDLTDQERHSVQAHLDVCAMCQRELKSCQSSEQMLTQAQQMLSPAGDLRAGFYARLAAEDHSNRNKFGSKTKWLLAFPALAACGLVIGLLDGRFRVPASPVTSANLSGNNVAVTPSSEKNSIAFWTENEEVLQGHNSYWAYTPPAIDNPVASPRPVSKLAAVKTASGSENLVGLRARAGAKMKNSSHTFNKLKTFLVATARQDKAAKLSDTLGKSTAMRFGLPFSGREPIQKLGTSNALAYIPQHDATDTYSANLTAKKNQDRSGLSKEESSSNYLYDSQHTVSRSSVLGVPNRDAPAKFARISSTLDTSTEDDGVNFQVRDTRRGFTTEMRLASQVELHDGRQVLTIHLEDNDDSLPKTDGKNADDTKAAN